MLEVLAKEHFFAHWCNCSWYAKNRKLAKHLLAMLEHFFSTFTMLHRLPLSIIITAHIRHIALSHITYLTLKSVSRIIFYFQMFINPNVFKSLTTIDFWCSTPTSITFRLPSTRSSCHQTAIVTRRPTEKSQTRKYVPLSKNKLPATQKSLQRALTIK